MKISASRVKRSGFISTLVYLVCSTVSAIGVISSLVCGAKLHTTGQLEQELEENVKENAQLHIFWVMESIYYKHTLQNILLWLGKRLKWDTTS